MARIFPVHLNDNFVSNVFFRSSILDDAVNWIRSNLDIDQVFEESDVVSYVKGSRLEPDDLFDEEVLTEWAEKNGFVKFFS